MSGEMFIDTNIEDNGDFLNVAWVSVDDKDKLGSITLPILEYIVIRFNGDKLKCN